MLYAIIEHKNNTLIMEFPCRRMTMAEHLASVGIRIPAHEIKCVDEENVPIKVKIFGESEFSKKLASVVSAEDTLSLVNSFCEMYQNMPYTNKQDIMEAVLQDKVGSLKEFGQLMMQRREQDVTEHYYCPLTAMVYPRNDYGDLEDYPDEYDGSYLAVYEDRIRELINKEESRDSENLAEYFDGMNSAVAKLKEIHFSTQNVDGILYGCIRVELNETLTPEEDAEIKDYLTGQCSDGLGESLEQREIRVEDGDMYVSFWHAGEEYFMLNSEKFDEYLQTLHNGMSMGGME